MQQTPHLKVMWYSPKEPRVKGVACCLGNNNESQKRKDTDLSTSVSVKQNAIDIFI